MNILIIGGGGREHAIARALNLSDSCSNLFAAPGNPGIFNFAEDANLNPSDFESVVEFCHDRTIDLVVIGPEKPLADGIADYLRSASINVFGPSRKAAMIESSKAFAKEFMMKYDIPTAKFAVFSKNEADKAHQFIDHSVHPVVIKADGLAAGKGVIISNNKPDSHFITDRMFGGMFENSGNTIVIEEYLEGEEVSVFAICDGKDYITLAPSQDHKKAFDEDKGPNTGGMGAYAPTSLVNDELMEQITNRIFNRAIAGMIADGNPFIGCLYAGLMIVNGEPYVIEFNARFGDPETQAVLHIFEGDFAKLLYTSSMGIIDKTAVRNVAKAYACCVIMASGGYPESYKTGYKISGINEAENLSTFVYHSGTGTDDNKIHTAGGRVLGVTAEAETLQNAIGKAYSGVKCISFKDMHYRTDIGFRGLKY